MERQKLDKIIDELNELEVRIIVLRGLATTYMREYLESLSEDELIDVYKQYIYFPEKFTLTEYLLLKELLHSVIKEKTGVSKLAFFDFTNKDDIREAMKVLDFLEDWKKKKEKNK